MADNDTNPLAIDPSDRRPAQTQPPRAAAGSRRPALVAGAVLIAVAGMGTGWFLSPSPSSKGTEPSVKIGRIVEEWPEIKDGVPALRPAAPISTGGSAPSNLPSTPTLSSVAGPTLPSAIDQSPSPALPRAVVPEPSPPSAAPTADPASATAALRQGTPEPISTPSRDVPGLSAPLPPRRPSQASEEARPKEMTKAAATARPAPTPARNAPVDISPPAVLSQKPPEPAPETDHVNVLGVKIPTLAATGRKIRETVEVVGDTVRSIPDRF